MGFFGKDGFAVATTLAPKDAFLLTLLNENIKCILKNAGWSLVDHVRFEVWLLLPRIEAFSEEAAP